MTKKDKPIWVFGYGSLFWYQNFNFVNFKKGVLKGYHREWAWISSSRGDAPTCSLKEGGEVKGIFFKLPQDSAEEELEKVRTREIRSTEVVKVNIEGFDGEVHFWTMGDNLSNYTDLHKKTGKELYLALAKRAKSIKAVSRNGYTAEEYARRVYNEVPDCPYTKMYIEVLDSISNRDL